MKNKPLFILISLLISFCSVAQTPFPIKPNPAQENKELKIPPAKNYGPPKQNIIKMNLLSPIYGTIMMFYQRNINNDNSFQIGCGYMNFDGFSAGSNYTNPHTESFYVTPEYRYMLTGNNMNGTFIAPFMKYSGMTYAASYSSYMYAPYPSYGSTVYDRYKFTYQTLGIGFCLGQQAVYRNKISMEIFAGPVYNMLLDKTSTVPSAITSSSSYRDFSSIEIDESINKINVKGYGVRAGFTIGFLF